MLIVVTVAILMVSLAGLSFVSMMSTEHKAAEVYGDELRLAGLVDSGKQLLCALLEQPPEKRRGAGGLLDNRELFRGMLVFEDKRTGHRGRFSVVSPRIENGEITGMRFGAENESTRLNLAVLPDWERQHPGAARAALMNLPGMTDSIADAILDWLDADAARRQFGAEADYYAGLNVPYAPRNGVPSSLEELLLIRGVTRELLFGADANFNHQLEPEETRTARAGSGSFQSGARLRWASLLTVYSAERNLNYRQQPRINLNDKDLSRLHGRLSGVFDPQWARFIIFYRQFGPYQAEEDAGSAPTARNAETKVAANAAVAPNAAKQSAAANQPKTAKQPKQPKTAGGAEAAASLDLSLPGKFKLSSVLDLIGARVKIGEKEETPGSPEKSPEIIESPFEHDRATMREYLPKLLDHATVVTAKVIRGRINVDEAPRAVLLGVPGLDGAMVEQIVIGRNRGSAAEAPDRRHATWLLTEGLVDLSRMKALMPYLTTTGDVYRAQIVAYFDRPGPSARAELVIDATSTPPRQVYWKDLRLLGRGYPLESLGAAPLDRTASASRRGSDLGRSASLR